MNAVAALSELVGDLGIWLFPADLRQDFRKTDVASRCSGCILCAALWISELHAARFRCCQGITRTSGDLAAFLFCHGGIDVQHERILVAAEVRDDEGHALGHQARDKRDIAAQAIEFCDDNFGLLAVWPSAALRRAVGAFPARRHPCRSRPQ